MEPEKAEAILSEHIRMCSDLHELFVEEGKIMRRTGLAPDESFLQKKEAFLPVLDKGLQLLQRINEAPESFSRKAHELVSECRAQIMKLMILDRENERLLLKCSLPPKMKEAYSKVGPGQIAKVYGKYAE